MFLFVPCCWGEKSRGCLTMAFPPWLPFLFWGLNSGFVICVLNHSPPPSRCLTLAESRGCKIESHGWTRSRRETTLAISGRWQALVFPPCWIDLQTLLFFFFSTLPSFLAVCNLILSSSLLRGFSSCSVISGCDYEQELLALLQIIC